MREILFEYGFKSVNGIVKKVYALSEIPNISKKCDVWNVLPVVYVRQFTGLTDKNGIKIFEGDKLKVTAYVDNSDDVFDLDPEMIKQEIIAVVTWDDNSSGFDLVVIEEDRFLKGWGFGYGEDEQEFEIIGTIHDKTKP